MPREAARRLIDKDGNSYYVVIPFDVNLDNMEGILLGMHQGIVKLQGYKLVSEGVYRLPDTVETDGKSFTFYKKVEVFNEFPELDPNDFSAAISDLIDRARNQSINRISIIESEWKAKYTELEREFDAEEIEKADFERCWNAAIEHACQKIDGVWCCSHDLKSILRTGKGTCTQ